ncbi:MAG: hypothetical protein JOZ27_03655 [Caulobacteraceae bacterium]|nr:hypothetical protein [Caulobacteraceae bacterium]
MDLVRHLGLALTALALCLVLGSNFADIVAAHSELEQLTAKQKITLASSGKFETQLNGIGHGLQVLANQGNPNAQRIVGVLRQNGVNVR